MKIRNLFLLGIIPFLGTSCATIWNTRQEVVTVHTSIPSKISINQDSADKISEWKVSTVFRSRGPLSISASTDSIQKSIMVKSHTSPLVYVNLITFYPFILVDLFSRARFAYPREIYLDMGNQDLTYLPFDPLLPKYRHFKNQVRITPNKLVDLSYPAVALGYERTFVPSFSMQGTGFWRLPYFSPGENIYPDNISGLGAAMEGKYFFENYAPQGHYISMEISYLASRYYSAESFYPDLSTRDSLNYFPFATDTGVTKKHTLTFMVKYGYQKVVKRWVFDFSIGIGIRHRDIRFIDPYGHSQSLRITPYELFPTLFPFDNPGKSWTVTIPINFRVGWTF